MGDPLTIGIAAIGLGTQIWSGMQQRKESQSARRDARDLQAQQMAQQAKIEQGYRDSQNSQAATDAANAARDRQRASAAGATGQRSTILTSPLGLLGEPAPTQRSLLGT